jgi:ABC-type sulfate transport system substrate-binding protein
VRGSTTTFVERGIGDVLLAWENEASGDQRARADQFDIVVPPSSIKAEPPVPSSTRMSTARARAKLRRRIWNISTATRRRTSSQKLLPPGQA